MTDTERIEELEREVDRLNRCLEDAQKAAAAYQVEREEDHEAILHLGASLDEEKAHTIHPLARVVLDEICDRVRRDGTDGYLSSVVAWTSAGFPITTKSESVSAPTKPEPVEVTSGAHLGTVREWIKWQFSNGDRLQWSSKEPLTGEVRIFELEDLAERIKDAVLREHRPTLISEAPPAEPPIMAMVKELRLDDSGHGWLTLVGEAQDIAGLATQWHRDVEIRVAGVVR